MLRTAIPVSLIVLFAACAVALSGAASANAGVTFTVDDPADALDANAGDGSCSTSGGTCTLRAAIMETNALSGADTIILPSGTYTLTIGGTGEDMATLGDLDVTDDLTLSGAGPETTIIDGNGSVIFDRVLHVVGVSVTASISGVTIRNGGSASYRVGGIVADGDLSVSNSHIMSNLGNGLECHSDLDLSGSTVGNNTGHGIYGTEYDIDRPAHVTVVDSTIHENGGNGIQSGSWGGLVVTNSTIRDHNRAGIRSYSPLLVENSTISGNTPSSYSEGGGITIISFPTATVVNSTIRDNATSWGGGGIISSGPLTVISSTICGNTAPYGGGILANGRLEMIGSTVCSNTASLDGGGIICGSGSGTSQLANSTLSGNRAGTDGGALVAHDATPSLNNVTIAGNTASGSGGIHVRLGALVNVANSILAGNQSSGLPAQSPDCSGTLISHGYNLIQDTTGCFIGWDTTGNLTGQDAVLDALQDNGGPTLTHALLPGSPAIDAGNPAGCTNYLGGLLLTDQRGMPRAGRCDIGAYELERLALHFSRKTANSPAAMPGDALTYTITIDNAGPLEMSGVLLTDTLPALVTYAEHSLTASAGDYGYEDGVVTWTGSVDASGNVSITFGATVSDTLPLGTHIANTATISGGGEQIHRTSTIFVGHRFYLPVVMKAG